MESKIKELASDNVLLSAYLLLEDARKSKAQLALELQAARDDRRAQHREFQEFMAELRETLARIQANFMLDATLLGLISPLKTGEEGCHERKGKVLNHSRMLDGFAKSGS